MWAARFIVTADAPFWARTAALAAAGMGISVVGCGCEAGIEGDLNPDDTPDGRPGCAVLLFTVSRDALVAELLKRVGQGVLTTPSSACFSGLESTQTVPVGGKLRYFGDGYQSSKRLAGRRYWRIPVADGEFLVEESFGIQQGVGGGNLIITASGVAAGLAAAQAAVHAISAIPGVITPFPGGVCRSPSRIGSRYKSLRASTNAVYCPTLKSRTETQLLPHANAAYEIVIDGLSESAVGQAMRAGLLAACLPGVLAVTAGNYGGKLGPYKYHLHELAKGGASCA